MPRHRRESPPDAKRRLPRPTRRQGLIVAVPVAIVALVVGAWGVDTAAGGDVARNVEVAGHDVGGKRRAQVRATVEAYAAELADRAVELRRPAAEPLVTTAGELGLVVDVDATVERVLDAGRSPAVLRPLRWLVSFISPHQVEPVLRADVDAVYHAVVALEQTDRVPPVEPTMSLDGSELVLVPGQPGSGIDVPGLAEQLPEAALGDDDPIVVDVDVVDLPPLHSDDEVAALVEEANELTRRPLTVEVAGATVEVPVDEQRGWLRLQGASGAPGEQPTLAVDEEVAIDDLAERLPELGEPPVDATVTLQDGRPVVVPGRDGTGCCEAGSGARIMEALRRGARRVELEATPRRPQITAADVEAWRITEPVGGARAWPERRSGEVGPGFTTFFPAGQSRVTNIHRIADLVRGAVIPPGGTFSVNEHVGRRTRDKGFVAAGAIRNGMHVDEVGGGVSQFSTTLFNAAYFAGLDIVEYQAHSEYFSRYPRGREATMGYPAPDLVIRNNTPYGVLIWTSHTATSVTVTLWSSPYATAEQTGIREGRSGNCAVVVTERTRTYPDGRTEVDEFRATYRPGEGQFC